MFEFSKKKNKKEEEEANNTFWRSKLINVEISYLIIQYR